MYKLLLSSDRSKFVSDPRRIFDVKLLPQIIRGPDLQGFQAWNRISIFTFLWSSGNAWLTRLFLRWKDPSLGIMVSCCSTDSSETERLTPDSECKEWQRSHYLYLLRTACPGCRPHSGGSGWQASSWSPSPGQWLRGWTAQTSASPGTGSGADLQWHEDSRYASDALMRIIT